MPKLVQPLSDPQIARARPRATPYKLHDGRGLYLEIASSGSKIWRYAYKRPTGKHNRLTLGRHPEVSFKEAREKQSEAQRLRAAGIDPAEHREAQRLIAQHAAANTFEKIAREWADTVVPSELPATKAAVMRRLEQHIFPALGPVQMDTIRYPTLVSVLKRVQQRHGSELAQRLCIDCRHIYAYARAHYQVTENLAAGAVGLFKVTPRKTLPSIDADELTSFLGVFQRSSGLLSRTSVHALRRMLLVFVPAREFSDWTAAQLDQSKLQSNRLRCHQDESDITADASVLLQLDSGSEALLRELIVLTRTSVVRDDANTPDTEVSPDLQMLETLECIATAKDWWHQ